MSVLFVFVDVVLVVIVCNEVVSIVCCLFSVKLFVDCMVVLDMGLIDDIVVIVQLCGVFVSYMVWMNDFLVVCNIVLQVVNVDWNFVFDVDEWLESGGQYLCMFSG